MRSSTNVEQYNPSIKTAIINARNHDLKRFLHLCKLSDNDPYSEDNKEFYAKMGDLDLVRLRLSSQRILASRTFQIIRMTWEANSEQINKLYSELKPLIAPLENGEILHHSSDCRSLKSKKTYSNGLITECIEIDMEMFIQAREWELKTFFNNIDNLKLTKVSVKYNIGGTQEIYNALESSMSPNPKLKNLLDTVDTVWSELKPLQELRKLGKEVDSNFRHLRWSTDQTSKAKAWSRFCQQHTLGLNPHSENWSYGIWTRRNSDQHLYEKKDKNGKKDKDGKKKDWDKAFRMVVKTLSLYWEKYKQVQENVKNGLMGSVIHIELSYCVPSVEKQVNTDLITLRDTFPSHKVSQKVIKDCLLAATNVRGSFKDFTSRIMSTLNLGNCDFSRKKSELLALLIFINVFDFTPREGSRYFQSFLDVFEKTVGLGESYRSLVKILEEKNLVNNIFFISQSTTANKPAKHRPYSEDYIKVNHHRTKSKSLIVKFGSVWSIYKKGVVAATIKSFGFEEENLQSMSFRILIRSHSENAIGKALVTNFYDLDNAIDSVISHIVGLNRNSKNDRVYTKNESVQVRYSDILTVLEEIHRYEQNFTENSVLDHKKISGLLYDYKVLSAIVTDWSGGFIEIDFKYNQYKLKGDKQQLLSRP